MARKKRQLTLAQKLANPGQRSKLPDKSLTPALLAKRRLNRRITTENKDPLYSPSVQLSGHDLASAARRLAGLEVDPAVAALDQQAKTVTQQGAALSDRAIGYLRDQGAAGQQARATAEAISQRLGASLKGVAGDTTAALDRAGSDELARQAADQGLRGAGLQGDSLARVQAEIGEQRAHGAQIAEGYRSSGALQGANSEALINAIVAAAGQHGGEIVGELANRQQTQLGDIASQRTATEGKRGPLQTKYLTDLRQTGFENLATMQGLNIKGTQLAQDAADSAHQYALAIQRQREQARHNQAGESVAQQNADTSAARFASQAEKDAYQRTHHLGSYRPTRAKGESQSSLNTKNQINNALLSYRDYLKPGKRNSKGKPYTLEQVEKKAADAKVPPVVRAAARELAQYGYLTPATEKLLRDAGVRVPHKWRRTGAQAIDKPRG